jgi:hypothetical protein
MKWHRVVIIRETIISFTNPPTWCHHKLKYFWSNIWQYDLACDKMRITLPDNISRLFWCLLCELDFNLSMICTKIYTSLQYYTRIDSGWKVVHVLQFLISFSKIFWSACTKPGKWVVMYMCVSGIDFASIPYWLGTGQKLPIMKWSYNLITFF